MAKVTPAKLGGLETLSDHNKRVGSAGVACDKCGTGMNHDREKERMERQQSSWPVVKPDGQPVKCPKCGYTGRLLNSWV